VDSGQAKKYGVKEGTKLLAYDFVLVTDEETKKAMRALGRENMLIIEGLPVPDVD
jgi:threonine dehydratase